MKHSGNLVSRLQRACHLLGLSAVTPFSITMASGVIVKAVALVKGAGTGGMLIVQEYVDVEDVWEELQKLGYGFSVMSEPPHDEDFIPRDYADMFQEWGLLE